MTPILVLTHGEFGPALLRSAEAMFGPNAAAVALGLAPEETRESFAERVRTAQLSLGAPALVLVDLACGTPWNVALTQGCAADGGEILAGLSLPILLEALGLCAEMDAKTLAKELVARVPQTFVRASELMERGSHGGCP